MCANILWDNFAVLSIPRCNPRTLALWIGMGRDYLEATTRRGLVEVTGLANGQYNKVPLRLRSKANK